MALYEHVFISRQDLSNAQAEGLIEHFSTVLSDNDGKVIDQEYWGLKTMAYKINKNRKGHYAFLKSDAPSSAVQEMERLMRLHEDVMRVMTIRVDERKIIIALQRCWIKQLAQSSSGFLGFFTKIIHRQD